MNDLRASVNKAFEIYDWYESEIISLGTAAVEIPSTPIAGAKELFVQNLHATQDIYIGGGRPDLIAANPGFNPAEVGFVCANIYAADIKWTKSGAGTNEYYATKKSTGLALGCAEPLRLFGTYLSTHVETALLTNGTMGALADHAWDWGDNDALGFSTVYWRDDTGDPDSNIYLSLLSYTKMPDSAGSHRGIKLAGSSSQPNSVSLIRNPTCKLFAIASGAATTMYVVQRG